MRFVVLTGLRELFGVSIEFFVDAEGCDTVDEQSPGFCLSLPYFAFNLGVNACEDLLDTTLCEDVYK